MRLSAILKAIDAASDDMARKAPETSPVITAWDGERRTWLWRTRDGDLFREVALALRPHTLPLDTDEEEADQWVLEIDVRAWVARRPHGSWHERFWTSAVTDELDPDLLFSMLFEAYGLAGRASRQLRELATHREELASRAQPLRP